MYSLIPALQATALCLAVLWLLLAIARRPRTPLSIVWAVFCASLAMAMARFLVGSDGGAWYQVLGLGACLTCNGFWLVSRALFREGRPFGAPHLAYAGIVAVLIVATRQEAIAPSAFIVVTGELLQLLAPVVLVLAFWEGLRGWDRHHGVERSMRLVYLVTYGGCVAVSFVAAPLLDPAGTGDVDNLVSAVAASAILLMTQGLVAWRLRHPVGTSTVLDGPGATEPTTVRTGATGRTLATASEPDSERRSEDAALARRLESFMRQHEPYLRTELKLSHFAQALDVSEYRISRAVRAVLGHRNINHYINQYRIDHACSLLSNPDAAQWSTLVVGLESGFGSLGAFHRAFKASRGCTPGEFRNAGPDLGHGARHERC